MSVELERERDGIECFNGTELLREFGDHNM